MKIMHWHQAKLTNMKADNNEVEHQIMHEIQ